MITDIKLYCLKQSYKKGLKYEAKEKEDIQYLRHWSVA
jgi:hypothetical protein